MDFSVPSDQRAKVKAKKRINSLIFFRRGKKLCNVKVSVRPVVEGGHGTVSKSMEDYRD